MVKTIKFIQNLPDGRKSVSLYNSFAKTDFIRLFARGFFRVSGFSWLVSFLLSV